jgi:hypothetical protein
VVKPVAVDLRRVSLALYSNDNTTLIKWPLPEELPRAANTPNNLAVLAAERLPIVG